MKRASALAVLSVVMILTCANSAWAQKASLPFIDNDYPQALAQARERNLPLFVEAWAPWCHTCRYMRAYVFTDAALTSHADRFTWLAIDSDNPKNAAFVEKFPFEALPAFLVIDAKTEKVVLRWYGSATVDQMARLLDDGQLAWKGGGDAAEAALARADRLNGDGKALEAAHAYIEALQTGGPNWPRRERAVESLVMTYSMAKSLEDCARSAIDLAPALPRGHSFLTAVDTGLSCAMDADKEKWAPSAVAKLKPLEEEALRLPNQLADDHAGVFSTLMNLYDAEKNCDALRKLLTDFAAFLDQHEKTAPNPEARASLDSYRAMLAINMGQPSRAIQALQASERDLPNDYNPPSRLSRLYTAMGRYDDALAANQRAIDKAYGSPRIKLLSTRSSIYQKKGDKAAAVRALQEAIKLASSQPKHETQVASLQEQLDRLK